MRIALTGFAFPSAVRMIDRIHDNAAHMRPTPEPAAASGLADVDIFVVKIADLADRGHAGGQDPAHFAGLEPYLHILAVTAHDLGKPSRTADQLPALSRLQFDVMNRRSQWHVRQRQCITRAHFCIGAGLQDITYLKADWRQDISLLSI